ncbi:MAG: response regulator [Desulfobacterales bacterium]|nr:response regulator [Desulfobacterales bacterium]
MNASKTKNMLTALIFLLFISFITIYELYNHRLAQGKIEEHAVIIADSLWNFHYQGAAEYLKLVANAHSYKTLIVKDHGGGIFQKTGADDPGVLDRTLIHLKLIPEVDLNADVKYNGNVIGRIEAVWWPRTIFTYAYVLFALLLIITVIQLYFRIVRHKGMLEDTVRKRTEELAQSNASLQIEVQQKKKTEETLRESEESFRKLYEESSKAEEVYRSLLNSSADAIVTYNMQGYPEYLSESFTRIFGWTLAEVRGDFIPFVPESEMKRTLNIITDLIENGVPCQGFETQRYTKTEQLLDISLSASRYNDHQGKPIGMLVVLRDISARKRLESQLQHADRMEAIGTLAGGIAHDFNNLLMGIQGNASLCLLDQDSNDPAFERLKNIETYIRSGVDLTKQLLGFARGGKYETRPTDLNEIVRDENRMFGRAKKEIAIHEDYEENLWTVEVDRGQIKQVLLNLYVNAWHAMPGGGCISVRTRNTHLDEGLTRSYEASPGKYIVLTVTDTGIGMDSETRQKIFNPFFTTKEMGRGTGLGLASVYGIVKNHDGIIDVDSRQGEGTTFTVYLPATEKKSEQEQQPKGQIVRGAGTVLLVDDEEMIIDVGAKMIKAIGYDVITAAKGSLALEIYKESGEEIDVVLLDMIMPTMGGGELFDKLKHIDGNVRVILSSGYSLDGKASEIMNRGCNGFIQKPFNIKELSGKLHQVLQEDNSRME